MLDKPMYVLDDTAIVDSTTNNYLSHKKFICELNRLHTMLSTCKSQISINHLNNNWDQYKKYTNAYEAVYSPMFQCEGVSAHFPVSRSFFKLWEILIDYESELGLNYRDKPLKCAFLAEGPGGFMEAMAKYRYDLKPDSSDMIPSSKRTLGDEYHGITLVSRNKNIPYWKLSPIRQYVNMGKSSITIHNGFDGTGNLYNLGNIDHFISSLSNGTENCVDLVTADGGFDFSNNFNDQEEKSLLLITSEVYITLRLQKIGGSCVIKIYDIHTEYIVCILYLLKRVYNRIHLIKPCTSRPANSEKYVVCTGFKGRDEIEYEIQCLRASIMENSETPDSDKMFIDTLSAKMPATPYIFIRNLVDVTKVFVYRQMAAINKVIELIIAHMGLSTHASNVKINRLLKQSINMSTIWCENYNIDIRRNVLIKQKFNLNNKSHKSIVPYNTPNDLNNL